MQVEGGKKLKLNLGCGQRRLDGFVNVDSQPGCAPDSVVDLEQTPWPWPDDAADEVALLHVLEHLGQAPAVYLDVMKELWRVCCDGARIRIAVPHPRSDEFLNDPTHVRPITVDGLLMFSQRANAEWAAMGAANTPLGRYLGIDFDVVSVHYDLTPEWLARFQAGEVTEEEIARAGRAQNNVYSQLVVELRAIKPAGSQGVADAGEASDVAEWHPALQAAQEAGDLAQAFAVLQGVLTRYPKDGEALAQLAAMQHALGDAQGALVSYRLAEQNGEFGWQFYNNFGVLSLTVGETDEAVRALVRAEALAPAERVVRLNLAEACGAAGQVSEAVVRYEKLIGEDPRQPEVYAGLAKLFNAQGWFDDALKASDMARGFGLADAEVLNQRGIACRELGRFEEALADFVAAQAFAPDSVALCLNIAKSHARLGHDEVAKDGFRAALAACGDMPSPEVSLAFAFFLLARGETAEGWRHYEGRRGQATVSPHPLEATLPRWQGETPAADASLLVIPEQGFGDNLQFAALLPRLAGRFGRICLQTRPALMRLLARSLEGVCEVVDKVPEGVHFDWVCPVASLPAALDLAVPDWSLPAYLQADKMQAALWGFRIPAGTQKKVGLCWSGGKAARFRQRCDLPLSEVERLLDGDVRWVSLQKEGDEAWRQTQTSAGRLVDLMGMVNSFDDTAALISNLDLVITIDTSVAHLAAGLGKPVWLLLVNDADWRWLQGRADSPWYPGMRLFRQAQAGNWEGVVNALLDELSTAFARA